MKSYYTLIKISANPTTRDLITVGILAATEENIILRFSDRKINAILRLIDEDDKLFSFFRKQLEDHISKANIQLKQNVSKLIQLPTFLTSAFFSHLNSMSKNLIQFSDPSPVDSTFSQENFDKLYSIFVDKSIENNQVETVKEDKLFINVQEKLVNKVSNKVHTNIEINHRIIPSLYFSLKLDCLGKNGSIVAAKSIDFNATAQTIEKNLIRFGVVLSKLNKNYGNSKNQAFLISDEPSTKESENYNIWESITQESPFDIIASDHADQVADIIQETNAQKFLPIDR